MFIKDIAERRILLMARDLYQQNVPTQTHKDTYPMPFLKERGETTMKIWGVF
jgi:hypothetical protein